MESLFPIFGDLVDRFVAPHFWVPAFVVGAILLFFVVSGLILLVVRMAAQMVNGAGFGLATDSLIGVQALFAYGDCEKALRRFDAGLIEIASGAAALGTIFLLAILTRYLRRSRVAHSACGGTCDLFRRTPAPEQPMLFVSSLCLLLLSHTLHY